MDRGLLTVPPGTKLPPVAQQRRRVTGNIAGWAFGLAFLLILAGLLEDLFCKGEGAQKHWTSRHQPATSQAVRTFSPPTQHSSCPP